MWRNATALTIAVAIATCAASEPSLAAGRGHPPGAPCLAADGRSYPEGSTLAFNPCPGQRCAAASDMYLTCRSGRWLYRNGTPYRSLIGELPAPSR
jgi:hypothetical protein